MSKTTLTLTFVPFYGPEGTGNGPDESTRVRAMAVGGERGLMVSNQQRRVLVRNKFARHGTKDGRHGLPWPWVREQERERGYGKLDAGFLSFCSVGRRGRRRRHGDGGFLSWAILDAKPDQQTEESFLF